jgi:hypothetical protein
MIESTIDYYEPGSSYVYHPELTWNLESEQFKQFLISYLTLNPDDVVTDDQLS